MTTVENPCQKNVFVMPRCGNTYACHFCAKNVTDLRHASTAEVEKFTAENKNACIVIHARHEAETTGKFNWINRIEKKLLSTGWKKTALATVMILVFLVSCTSRRKPPHKVGKFKEIDKKENTAA